MSGVVAVHGVQLAVAAEQHGEAVLHHLVGPLDPGEEPRHLPHAGGLVVGADGLLLGFS